jgi:hypothetical protein
VIDPAGGVLRRARHLHADWRLRMACSMCSCISAVCSSPTCSMLCSTVGYNCADVGTDVPHCTAKHAACMHHPLLVALCHLPECSAPWLYCCVLCLSCTDIATAGPMYVDFMTMKIVQAAYWRCMVLYSPCCRSIGDWSRPFCVAPAAAAAAAAAGRG